MTQLLENCAEMSKSYENQLSQYGGLINVRQMHFFLAEKIARQKKGAIHSKDFCKKRPFLGPF